MKKVLLCSVFFAALLTAWGQKTTKVPTKTVKAATPAAPIIKTLLDSFSYAAGFNVGNNMKSQGITDLNFDLMIRGIEDYYKNKTPLLAPELGNKCLQRQIEIFNTAKAEADKKKAEAEKATGIAYLNENKKRKEVVTLPDGLQYEIVKAGDSLANKPTPTDTVVVNYIGTLTDGKEFDNSYKRGSPAVFPVNGVIRGWTEILQLMTPGAHWKVYIPNELAYGENPPPGSGIAPGAPLVFDILLEGIKPGKPVIKQ